MVLGQVGSGLVLLSLLLFLSSIALRLMGDGVAQKKWARATFVVGTVSLFAVFGVLLTLFLTHQYQYRYVFGHSKLDYELQYKISGVWAGQEGSILLWSCLTAAFGVWTLKKFGENERWYSAVYAGILSIMVGISAFESPFKMVTDAAGHVVAPSDGQGMSPALLNYWMVIHPPTIFVGFALTAVTYSLAMAALLGKNHKDWILQARPWALTCLGFLGLGLCMGGFWAYETLGWGGFWMWDPVENTSFVPWCAMAAFIHGIFVQQSRSKGQMTNIALGAAPFLLFCYGTFLTRSGFLGGTSVHSFAKMDPQALAILIGLLGITIGGFLLLFIPAYVKDIKARNAEPPKEKFERTPFNLTVFYGIAMWMLFAFGLVTAIGMSVPLVQSLAGQPPKVVEESTYNQVLGWFFIPTMLAIGLGPFLTWRGLPFKQLMARIINPLALAVMFTGFLLLWFKTGWNGISADPTQTTSLSGLSTVSRMGWISFLACISFFAIFTNGWRLVEMMPRSRWTLGGVLTHMGVVLTILGLIVSRGLEQKKLLTIHPSREAEAFGYNITYKGPTIGFEDRNNEVALDVKGERGEFAATPGLYFRPGPEGPQETIWPHIERRPLYDLYFTLFPMVYEASEAQALQIGDDARYENVIITYRGMETKGTPGTDSAQFFAHADVQVLGEKVEASPSLLLGTNEQAKPAPIDNDRFITLLKADIERNSVVVLLSSSPKMPLTLTQGASLTRDNVRLTLVQLRTEMGETPDQARLVADFTAEPIEKVMKASPWMGLSGEEKVRIDEDYSLALERIDAGTKAAYFRFDWNRPAYPLEVFYKPLTWLVWFGVGIMTIGALASAQGRRMKRGTAGPGSSSSSSNGFTRTAIDESLDESGPRSPSEERDAALPASKV